MTARSNDTQQAASVAHLENADEIAHVGVEIVKNALLNHGVRSFTVEHFSDGPQIRFSVEIDGRPQRFAVDVEPFLPAGGDPDRT